jgi:hypothetical protein
MCPQLETAATPRADCRAKPRATELANHRTMGQVCPNDDAMDHSAGPPFRVALARQSLYGMWCAITEPGKWKLRVLDFNPGRIGRAVAICEARNDGKKVQERLAVTAPSIIPAGLCFLHDIKSSFLYYEIKRSGPVGNFFMDDEWIAEVKVGFNYSDEVDV